MRLCARICTPPSRASCAWSPSCAPRSASASAPAARSASTASRPSSSSTPASRSRSSWYVGNSVRSANAADHQACARGRVGWLADQDPALDRAPHAGQGLRALPQSASKLTFQVDTRHSLFVSVRTTLSSCKKAHRPSSPVHSPPAHPHPHGPKPHKPGHAHGHEHGHPHGHPHAHKPDCGCA